MLTQNDIDSIIQEFGPVRWVSFNTTIPSEGLFLLTVTPLPPREELEAVVADICAENVRVNIRDGKVHHSSRHCHQARHRILDHIIRKAVRNLTEVTFHVAVHPNIAVGPLQQQPSLNGQPIAIVYEPEITYMSYPYHPHLNMGWPDHVLPGSRFGIPDSLCYTTDPRGLGETQQKRLVNAFDQVVIWLLRHQVWEATHPWHKPGLWIGPHEGNLNPIDFLQGLNPFGACRCGQERLYKDCHMPNDLESVRREFGESTSDQLKKHIDTGGWIKYVYGPQRSLFQALKRL